ncbi:hypothetical protein [Egbenema bharatensis]|uniref:hypothetical protein n=1 Tax=Egbenema bharatensis TaxID=3463334 RepID=UPI003A83F191
MTLTVGASLQHNKYEIQDILNLSDLGVTYQAIHTYLNQPVILHTFNQVAQQRPDIDQLKQQFKQQVRSLVQQPQSSLRILDCFEENNLPFAVLPFQPDQPPVKLSDWFSVAVEAVEDGQVERSKLIQGTGNAQDKQLPDQPLQNKILQDKSLQDRQSQPVGSTVQQSTLKSTLTAPAHSAPAASFPYPSTPVSSLATPSSVARSSPAEVFKSPRRQRIPAALMVASLVGGFVGAGMGLALRIAATPQENGKAALNLFNKEQSFPSAGSWPIRERAIYTPETAIEQPLYRTNSSPETVDPWQTLPSESYPSYSPPAITDSISPSPELGSDVPLKELPSDNAPSSPAVELPPDVDSLYTDEWLPPVDTLPPGDQYTAPMLPSVPNDISPLPPQSNQTLPSSPSKRFTPNGLSVVNQ